MSDKPTRIIYSNNHKGKGKNYDENIVQRRQQVIIMIGEGLPLSTIAKRLDVSYETILDDKKAITKAGIKFLRSLGNKELSFYYQAIIADLNHIKNDLWGIIKREFKDEDPEVTKYYPKDKIQAYKVIKECNTELREVFKESIALFVIEEYDRRIKHLESINNINNNNNKTNYFNQGLPRLDK